ncbi:hypothetical protein [Streptomyces sp. NPDC002054]|uniref:hypothetical protein n=1 Tax=Streptomyces sp. NPDC002054 TaxID=3154663 RepID=UPI0033220172
MRLWRRRRNRATAETKPDTVRARSQAPEPEPEPGTDPWQDWLSRSPEALTVRQRWADGVEQTARLGEDGYCERLGELLSRLSPRDFAALGLGCSRRIDRACREPQTCSQDPIPPPAGERPAPRQGPVAGACSDFWDCYTRYGVRAVFTADDRHRAVTVHGTHIVDPEPHENWSFPAAVLRDGQWRLYPTLEARDTDRPDRTLTLP